jgi:hypothetical protein
MLCNNDILSDTKGSAKFPVYIRRSAVPSVTFGSNEPVPEANTPGARGLSTVLAFGRTGSTTLFGENLTGRKIDSRRPRSAHAQN